jgi:hypothetical protein
VEPFGTESSSAALVPALIVERKKRGTKGAGAWKNLARLHLNGMTMCTFRIAARKGRINSVRATSN